jgi:autophagy-related protein 17
MSTSPPQEQSRSPSPLPAGANSEHDNDNNDDPYASQIDIPLPTLVAHLLASKRSLSSITTVYTANHLVESARSSLSSSLILSSRTSFLRTGIAAQSRILRKVRKGIDAVYAEGVRDFEEVIRRLDDADARLQATMDVLRSTVVEAQFRPEEEGERSLLDFVDEAGVEGMRTALKESIRHSQV